MAKKISTSMTCPYCLFTYGFMPEIYLNTLRRKTIPKCIKYCCDACYNEFNYFPYRTGKRKQITEQIKEKE